MQFVFLYGPPAAGKLTVARLLAAETGYALFHNHLVVDTVHAVFPFGSPSFMRLREQFWLDVIGAAAAEDRSLIFTFQPEPTVSPDFAQRAIDLVTGKGGHTFLAYLKLPAHEQLARISNPDRAAFGKLRDADLLRTLQPQFAACEAAMPTPHLTVDTATTPPAEIAARILAAL
ncbi:MAG TPA: shikimate kinase [Hyphomonas sp.]|nr:shikimate kinase [Hyphomonas sp.]HRJ00149.1 shikimate kinase [Hyphomonas sp.]